MDAEVGRTGTDAASEFAGIVGESHLLTGERIGPDYQHDEALVGEPVAPRFVARPRPPIRSPHCWPPLPGCRSR